MHNAIDLTERRFGRLVAKSVVDRNGMRCWLCVCDCGGTKTLRTARLTGGRPTLSCGCLQREMIRTTRTTHGRSRSYLYRTRAMIIQRCTNPNNPAYSAYGGRGITICARWLASIEDFAADVGEKPSAKHTLDRIDNDKGYEPGNVRWATRTEQARNTRNSHLITANGQTKTLAEWIALSGLHTTTIERRLKRGWNPAEAVLTPSTKS